MVEFLVENMNFILTFLADLSSPSCEEGWRSRCIKGLSLLPPFPEMAVHAVSQCNFPHDIILPVGPIFMVAEGLLWAQNLIRYPHNGCPSSIAMINLATSIPQHGLVGPG